MSDQQQDRPADLRGRRRPQPAPDERVDPVDYRQAAPASPAGAVSAPAPASPAGAVSAPAPAAAPATAPRRGRPRREATIPFSTRLAPDVVELIDNAVASGEGEGTIRGVIEEAVRARYIKNS